MNTGISAINERVKEESAFIATLRAEIGKVIVGQNYLVVAAGKPGVVGAE